MDARELAGDAVGALELMSSVDPRPGDERRWPDSRLRRLCEASWNQGGTGWVWGRWARAQALDRMLANRAEAGSDWAQEQDLLYEREGLRSFLRHPEARWLTDMADGLDTWADAPVRALAYVGSQDGTLQWRDVRTGACWSTVDLGAGARLRPGDCVIGRLVVCGGQAIFDAAPLQVPEPLAHAVARAPSSWLEAVTTHRSVQVLDVRSSTRLCTDLPDRSWWELARSTLEADLATWTDRLDADGVRASVVVAAVRGRLPSSHDELYDTLPAVSAALTDPLVWDRAAERLDRGDLDALRALSARLSEPAAVLCQLMWLLVERRA